MNRPIHFIFTFFVYVLPILMIILPFNTSAAIIDIDDIVSSKHNAKFNHKLHTIAHHLHSDWTNCGNINDKGKIKYLDILPDPLIKGKKAIIKYDFFSSETITGGVVKIDVKLHDVSIYHKQYPICNKHIKCPIKQGNYNSSQTVTIPSHAPTGEYLIQINAYDQNNNEIFCIKDLLDIKSHYYRHKYININTIKSLNPQIIWQIGKTVWNFINNNEPSINITNNWGGAVPKGLTKWQSLQDWREDVWTNNSKPFFFEFKSGFFGKITKLEWVWSYKYNGNYNGVGKYITQAMPVIKNAFDITTENLSCTTRVWNPINYGTSVNPIAGIDMDLSCFSHGKFEKNLLNCHVILRGDNKHQIVTCNTGILHL